MDKKISTLGSHVMDLSARSMRNNILIKGIMENNDEGMEIKALTFMREYMKMQVEDSEVVVAVLEVCCI